MVSENGHSHTTTPPIVAGGAESALDMHNERDRALVREAIRRWPHRWGGLDADKKARLVDGLMAAEEAARRCLDGPDPMEAAKAIASIVRTGVVMEGQVQADQHAMLKAMVPDRVQHEGEVTFKVVIE